MLKLHHVSKKYKRSQVLNDISYRFDTGVTLITGPSGAGKSTLLRMCASAEKASSGSISWRGQDINKSIRTFRQTLGYAPQKIEFPLDLTAKDFMLHIGALKGLKRKACEDQTFSLFNRLGLANDINKTIQAYSGGMCRRLGLAQAFLGQPQCLIIDEPSAELDPLTASRVHDLIFDTAKNSVVIMTTHLESSIQGQDFNKFDLSTVG